MEARSTRKAIIIVPWYYSAIYHVGLSPGFELKGFVPGWQYGREAYAASRRDFPDRHPPSQLAWERFSEGHVIPQRFHVQ